MVGDLVVADERGVEDGTARVGVADHGLDGDVAEDDHGDGAQERVAEAALHAGHDVAADLLRGGEQLAADVDDPEHQRAEHRVRVGEVREVVGAAGRAGLQRGDREARVLGVARDEVAAARAAAGEEAAPVGVAALDLRGARGVVRDDELAALLLVPAERGDVLVRAVQDAGLAGAGLRRPVALPALEAAVLGLPDDDLGERIAAWVVIAPDAGLADDELVQHVADQLAPHKRPRAITRVAELP
ncbi:MAG: AMP-binding enzyme, partial [Actinomycetota bacterium]